MDPIPDPDAASFPLVERVRLPGRETDVRIGSGVRRELAGQLTERFARARRCAVVGDAHVLALWPVAPSDVPLEVVEVRLPPGEAAKERDVLARVQDALIELRRDEPVVVIGGGAALDVGGFAAATVRRGLPWVAVATSVIAMADAAVGGKVAVNHPRGKNLLGTFHPPRLVLCDVETLSTLDARERVSGLAELYKCARIGDSTLLADLRGGAPDTDRAWGAALQRSVAVKARLVEQDERDGGVRRRLNYGHTVGHALERVLGNEAMRHGEAIAIGMGVAARIAGARGLFSEAKAARQAADLSALGLPVAVPGGVAPEALLDVLGLDKKRTAGTVHTFVLPLEAGGVRVYEDVTASEILTAL